MVGNACAFAYPTDSQCGSGWDKPRPYAIFANIRCRMGTGIIVPTTLMTVVSGWRLIRLNRELTLEREKEAHNGC